MDIKVLFISILLAGCTCDSFDGKTDIDYLPAFGEAYKINTGFYRGSELRVSGYFRNRDECKGPLPYIIVGDIRSKYLQAETVRTCYEHLGRMVQE